jgi:hypothetical protein
MSVPQFAETLHPDSAIPHAPVVPGPTATGPLAHELSVAMNAVLQKGGQA